MKAKEIQDLIDFISNSGLAEVKIETEGLKLSIKKNSEVKTQIIEAAPVAAVPAPTPTAAPATNPASAAAPVPEQSNNYVEVKSPMIGTFYRSPNPDSDVFVNVGDSIASGQTVCIIEAMKLFNEIEAEVSGKVVEILVDDASPVEYDQPLFLIDPAG